MNDNLSYQIISPQKLTGRFSILLLLFSLLLYTSCRDEPETKTIEVHASAYNSHPSQTSYRNPSIAAWGDTLKPGMKAIAISRDLLDSGLTHKQQVKISGLEGKYTVLDKMNNRWKKRIDIYMGNNRDSALEWGIKTVKITWEVPDENNNP
ncbi:MAG: 3D domain-containing protein [Bacteroidales bacterium]|nr:3D domain-containing protein [Bacteroidales bacterium]MCF8328372.1 3D domain-containing protein [Bacteroidales bacterium]